MPPDDRPLSGPDDVTCWLVIPYFPGDVGRPEGVERPLTDAKAISWLCPSIVLNGQPGNFSFQRGQPIRVTVDVANYGYGSLTALVRVTLWWADPTLGFASAHPCGEVSVPVPPGGTPVTSPPMTFTIPLTAPPHVCLLARATTALDGTKAGIPPDPVGDRHWAQANLTESVAAADGSFDLTLQVANPFGEEMLARFAAAPLSDIETSALRGALGRDVVTGSPEDVRLVTADGTNALEGLPVPAKGQLTLTFHGKVPGIGAGGTYFKILQSLARPGEHVALEGALGVRVTGN